jgi:hypothetical protein
MPKQGLPTGTEIRNQAEIVFDVNAPIVTPEWLNTLDNTTPTSQVSSLAATQSSPTFTVQWSGTDVGSGVKDYTIFVSEDGEPFTVWLSNVPDTAGTFSGQDGKAYAFYSVARDQTNNIEDVPPTPDTSTLVAVAGKDLTTLDPATVWVGLKNSDAVGLRLDLRAEVFLNGNKIGEGRLNNIASGSSGFNNAKLNTVVLSLANGPVEVPPDAAFALQLSVRRTCFGGGHNAGTPRLWFNDSQANSRFGALIDETASDFFLRDAFALAPNTGTGPKKTIDVTVDSKTACPERPFKPFGTWSMTLQ